MPLYDAETLVLFKQRWDAVAQLRELWNCGIRAPWFYATNEPYESWEGETFTDETHAIAAAYVAIWPE